MNRISMLIGLFILSSMVVGCSSSSISDSNRTKYDSPQSAFEAFATAGKKGQWEVFANTLTPESQEMFATMMMFPASMIASTNDAASKEVEAILERHGIDANDQSENADIGQIKDKPGFIADIMAFLSTQDEGNSKFDIPNGKLKELKIQDDSATALLDEETIEFKKVNGGWLVHFDMSN